MERLGVSCFPLYPLQIMLHIHMYKQFYMTTVDFWRTAVKKLTKEETSNLETSAPAWCFAGTVVYRSFQPKKKNLLLLSSN